MSCHGPHQAVPNHCAQATKLAKGTSAQQQTIVLWYPVIMRQSRVQEGYSLSYKMAFAIRIQEFKRLFRSVSLIQSGSRSRNIHTRVNNNDRIWSRFGTTAVLKANVKNGQFLHKVLYYTKPKKRGPSSQAWMVVLGSSLTMLGAGIFFFGEAYSENNRSLVFTALAFLCLRPAGRGLGWEDNCKNFQISLLLLIVVILSFSSHVFR